MNNENKFVPAKLVLQLNGTYSSGLTSQTINAVSDIRYFDTLNSSFSALGDV